MADDQLQARAVSWYYREQFGFSKAPPRTDAEVVRNMAAALLAIASGDGDLGEEERAWIIGYFAAKRYPRSSRRSRDRRRRTSRPFLP